MPSYRRGSRCTADAHAHAQMHQCPPADTTLRRSLASWRADCSRKVSDIVTHTSWPAAVAGGSHAQLPDRVHPVVVPSLDCVRHWSGTHEQ